MTTLASYEFEALPELEAEGEFEAWEEEFEGDLESEAFFSRLAGLARQAAQSPTLRRVGLSAARSALGSLGSLGGALGGPSGSGGAALGTAAGAGLGNYLSGLLPQSEFEEFEGEFEFEDEVSPLSRVYPDALMEHLGHMAKDAESEAEAEAFIGALVPLAARLVPRALPAIMRTAPQLIRGAASVARTLRRNPATRPLVRTLPTIVRRTTADLARQVARGQPLTSQTAVRALARQTHGTLSNPQRCVQAYRHSRAKDQRYHRAARA